MLTRNLLVLRQSEFVAVLIEDKHLLGPCLVNFTGEDFADLVRVFVIEVGFLYIHDSSLKILADIEDSTSSEIFELHLSGKCLAEFVVVAVIVDLLQRNLGVGVLHILHNLQVLVDLAVSLVDIDDDVEVVSRAESLGKLCHENILEHTHHYRAVNMLFVLEKRKRGFEVDFF